jgi:hypothetical protein
LKKILVILFIFLGIGFSSDFYAQTGGKKREKKSKKRGNAILTQYKSHGHADDFARANGRTGRFARLFKKKKSSWTYKSSGSKRSQYKANRYLFFRHRSEGKIENEHILTKQNTQRKKERVKGSKSFKHKRNYKSR